MRRIIFIVFFFSYFAAFSQQQYVKFFDVIISLSATETDNKAGKIKTLISSDTTGLTYEGYCISQKCIILKANSIKFSSGDAVLSYLKLRMGDAVLANKDYTVKEFYRLCTFASEQEYNHFKTTYK